MTVSTNMRLSARLVHKRFVLDMFLVNSSFPKSCELELFEWSALPGNPVCSLCNG